MLSRLNLRYPAVLFCLGLLLSYQNCSQAPDATMMGSQSSYEASLPFAYRARLDTISYMSCAPMNASVDRKTYFTFRAGAYDNQALKPSGLSLTEEFVNKTVHFTTEQRARALGAGDVNGNVQLNLSVRDRYNLQLPWLGGKERKEWSSNQVESFLPPLDTPDVAGELAGTGNPGAASYGRWINYFRGPGSQRLMEASLHLYDYENSSVNLRTSLAGGSGDVRPGYLVMGYAGSWDPLEQELRVPAATSSMLNRAYGVGYEVKFEPLLYDRAVKELQEIDLTTGRNTGAQWTCDAVYRFQVVRPEDQVAVNCVAGPDYYANVVQQDALNVVRRVLRAEDWFVDVVHLCVVPKRTLQDVCYGDMKGASIQYGNFNCKDNNATSRCPHYVSVCVRR